MPHYKSGGTGGNCRCCNSSGGGVCCDLGDLDQLTATISGCTNGFNGSGPIFTVADGACAACDNAGAGFKSYAGDLQPACATNPFQHIDLCLCCQDNGDGTRNYLLGVRISDPEGDAACNHEEVLEPVSASCDPFELIFQFNTPLECGCPCLPMTITITL